MPPPCRHSSVWGGSGGCVGVVSAQIVVSPTQVRSPRAEPSMVGPRPPKALRAERYLTEGWWCLLKGFTSDNAPVWYTSRSILCQSPFVRLPYALTRAFHDALLHLSSPGCSRSGTQVFHFSSRSSFASTSLLLFVQRFELSLFGCFFSVRSLPAVVACLVVFALSVAPVAVSSSAPLLTLRLLVNASPAACSPMVVDGFPI